MAEETKQYLEAQLKAEGDALEFVASNETVDRHGESLPISSWDLKNYLRNPVLLIDHDYKVMNIVGASEKTYSEGKDLRIQPIFHAITEIARQVAEMVKQGIVKTVSVGYLPHENEDGTVTNELLEVSFVAIPANPDAMMIPAKSIKKKETEIETFLKQFVLTEKDEKKEADEKGEVSDEMAQQQMMQQKYENLSMVFDVVYAMCDVYMNEETPVENFNTLVGETADLLKQMIGSPEPKAMLKDVKEIPKAKKLLMLKALYQIKEGRVLSKKNRELISNAVSVLQELLEATDSAPNEGGKAKKVTPETVEPKGDAGEHEVTVPRDLLEYIRGQMRVNDKHTELGISIINRILTR